MTSDAEAAQAARGVTELNASFQSLLERLQTVAARWFEDENIASVLAGPEPILLLPDSLLSLLPLEGVWHVSCVFECDVAAFAITVLSGLVAIAHYCVRCIARAC